VVWPLKVTPPKWIIFDNYSVAISVVTNIRFFLYWENGSSYLLTTFLVDHLILLDVNQMKWSDVLAKDG
jgi:hypothetical protein